MLGTTSAFEDNELEVSQKSMIEVQDQFLNDPEIVGLYQQLPGWYQKATPLTDIHQLLSGRYLDRCASADGFSSRCLNDRNFDLINSIDKRVLALWQSVLYPNVQSKLDALKADRSEKFNSILAEIAANPIFANGVIVELKETLTPFVESGRFIKTNATKDFIAVTPVYVNSDYSWLMVTINAEKIVN